MKTKTFKLLATLFVAALSLGFTACGDDDNDDNPKKPGEEEVDPGQTEDEDFKDFFPSSVKFKTYIVKTPGTLPTLIPASEKGKITALKIQGSINGTDLLFIREMAGRDFNNNEVEDASLVYLDLSEARIVEGGKAYFYGYMDGEEEYYNYTEEDILGDNAFTNTNLNSVALPKGVKSIGEEAFSSCALKSIYIGHSVKSIGGCAFYSCNSLTNINIPNSVTSIEHSAFYSCKNLININIPNSVTSIEYGAFAECWKLRDVIVHWEKPINISDLEHDVFYGTPSKTLHVPAGTLSAYKNDDGWNVFEKITEDADDYPDGK